MSEADATKIDLITKMLAVVLLAVEESRTNTYAELREYDRLREMLRAIR